MCPRSGDAQRDAAESLAMTSLFVVTSHKLADNKETLLYHNMPWQLRCKPADQGETWPRLAGMIFTPYERSRSNCRGVLGNTALDVYKVKAIYAACMQHFPLQHLETQLMADIEMRTAIDERC